MTRPARATAARGALLAAITVLAATPATAPAATAPGHGCPVRLDRDGLASAATLRALTAKEWSYGPRPTGGPAHRRMVAWLERELRRVHGLRVRSRGFRIDAWGAARRAPAGARRWPHAGAPRRGTCPLRPADRAVRAARTARGGPRRHPHHGRRRRRADRRPRRPAGGVPFGVFGAGALGWTAPYDPRHTIDPAAPFEGDFLTYDARVHDLRDAGAAGAAGVVFLKDLPRAQPAGALRAHEGRSWRVPGVFLGADEARALTAAVRADPGARATLTLRAHRPRVTTRTLLATLPGRSPQRLVIESHTDGTNAVEDNGPVAILALARALARLPQACRPRTIELVLHDRPLLPARGAAAPSPRRRRLLARQLDRDYDTGARRRGRRARAPRGARVPGGAPCGPPGRVLRPTGRAELTQVFATPSARLRAAVRRQVVRHRLERTALLAGADGPDPARAAEHCSFGGEGTPYAEHLLPTVALISAPAPLYDPAFGLASIDVARMRAQTLAFGDLALELSRMPARVIAGDVLRERARRRAGASGCPADL